MVVSGRPHQPPHRRNRRRLTYLDDGRFALNKALPAMYWPTAQAQSGIASRSGRGETGIVFAESLPLKSCPPLRGTVPGSTCVTLDVHLLFHTITMIEQGEPVG
jgi:hypothetical protein